MKDIKPRPLKYIFKEEEIYDLLEKEPDRIENGLTFIGKKIALKKEHWLLPRLMGKREIDLLFKDEKGVYLIVEIKSIISFTWQREKGMEQAALYRFLFGFSDEDELSSGWLEPKLVKTMCIFPRIRHSYIIKYAIVYDIELKTFPDIGISWKKERDNNGKMGYPVFDKYLKNYPKPYKGISFEEHNRKIKEYVYSKIDELKRWDKFDI